MSFVLGAPELHRKLAQLTAAAPLIGKAATATVAEEVAAEARLHAPVETGRLRDSIEASPDAVATDVEYASFVEFGTVNMSPQPFMRPAADTAERHEVEAAEAAAAAVRLAAR